MSHREAREWFPAGNEARTCTLLSATNKVPSGCIASFEPRPIDPSTVSLKIDGMSRHTPAPDSPCRSLIRGVLNPAQVLWFLLLIGAAPLRAQRKAELPQSSTPAPVPVAPVSDTVGGVNMRVLGIAD